MRPPTHPLRIAIVGAGPSGLYAADALASQEEFPVSIDVIDKLPVPFGLVRYGVAPDHFSIRSVRDKLDLTFDKPQVRFLGNVEIGNTERGLSVEEAHRFYDAVIWTYGASRDRALGIPGEDLDGSVAATDLVAWYTGHPEADIEHFETVVPSATSVVVVGVGNVAVDVARVLAKTPAELAATDMPQHVLDALARSTITDVHVLGRRGPAQATFTTKELRELGELEEVDVVVDPDGMSFDAASEETIASDKAVARNVEVIKEWASRTPTGKRKRVHMHFLARPVELHGDGRLAEVVVERTALDGTGSATGTGNTFTIDADLIVRAVGYRGVPIEIVPFDEKRNVIPHIEGRVMRGEELVPGEYVAGWIKRGPTGIIGTNKKDAVATVASLLDDARTGSLPSAKEPDPAAVDTLLAERGIQVVDTAGWRNIDAAERKLGASHGRDRETIDDRAALLAAARGQ